MLRHTHAPLRLVLTVIVAAVMVLLHLPTRAGRRALRDVIARETATAVPGSLFVGSVDVLTPREIKLSGINWTDDHGNPIVADAAITVYAPWRILLTALAHRGLPRISVHVRTVHARVPFLRPQPARASSGTSTATTYAFPDITLDVDEIRSELPGVPARALHTHLRLGVTTTGSATSVRIPSLDTTVLAFGLPEERLRGSLVYTPGPHVTANLALRGQALACNLDAGDDPSGRVRAEVTGCALSARAMDHLAGQANGSSLAMRLRLDDVSVAWSPTTGFDLAAALRINDQSMGVHARGTEFHQSADLRFDHVVLRDVVAELPEGNLDGTVHMDRRVQGAAQHFHADTAQLVAVVAGVPIPPMVADAMIEDQSLMIERLDAPEVGLSAHGNMDLARGLAHFRVDAELDTTDIGRLRLVAGRAHGALRLHLRARGEGDHISGDVEMYTQGLRLLSMSAAEAGIAGRADLVHGHPDVDVEVHARGISASSALGLMDVDGTVQGDPTRNMRVSLNARGNGVLAALGSGTPTIATPSSITTHATIEIRPDGVSVDMAPSTVQLRGARATLTGLVRIPHGRAVPQGHLRIDAGNLGRLDTTFTGTHVALRVEDFDLSWLAPVMGRDELAGVANGALDVNTAAIADSHARITLHNAVLDPLGGFEAVLEIVHGAGSLNVRTAINGHHGDHGYLRGTSIASEIRVRVPSDLTSGEGWLHGFDHGAVDVTGASLHDYQDLLPHRIVLDGHGTVHAEVRRPDAEGPLEVVTGLDAREVVAGTVFGAVVHPMRVRALACARIRSLADVSYPVMMRLAMGMEARPHAAATEPPPGNCDPNAALLRDPLVAAGATLDGPWLRALTLAATQLAVTHGQTDWPTDTRLALQHASLNGSVHVALARNHWPMRSVVPLGFSADEGVVILRPPDVSDDTRLDLGATMVGSMLGPTVTFSADYTSDDMRQVGLMEPMESHLTVSLSPAAGDLLGIMHAAVNAVVIITPSATGNRRGQIALDVLVHGDGSDLLLQGLSAVHVQRFDVDTQNLSLDRFSWARDRGLRGNFGLNFSAVGEQSVDAAFNVSNLQARIGDVLTGRDTPPVQSIVRADARGDGSGDWTVRGCVLASLAGATVDCDPQRPAPAPTQGSLRADVTVPLTGGLLHLAPAVDHSMASLQSQAFRLETLAPFVQGDTLASLGGVMSADLHWSGALPRQLQGTVDLHDGRIELVSVGEPFRAMELELRAHGPTLDLPRIDFGLGRGEIQSHGSVTLGQDLARDAIASVRLSAHAQTFPAEQEGNTFGWITGNVVASADVRPAETHIALDVQNASVLVQEESTRVLQPLGADADVYVYGRSALNPRIAGSATPMSITWQIDTPVWIRRSDFAVAAQGHGTVRMDASGMAMDGAIESASTQSWFAIFGKRFTLDRIAIRFDGNIGINPELDIAAHMDSPSVGRLSVTIAGRMRAPSMTFSSERYPEASQSEVLAMIVLGRRDTESASSQGDLATSVSNAASSLVAGLTLGFVTSALQSQFSFLPTLIADPGEANGGRYGAGVSISPRLYVQATYGAAAAPLGSTDTSAATQSEVRVFGEYAVSPSISVSASYGTALNRWGADVFWSP